MKSLAGCVLKQPAKLSTTCFGLDSGIIEQADLVLQTIDSFGELELSVDELLNPGEKSAMEC